MRLLVIDGNSIANRAFYGIKLLTTKDGRYTNAIFGFLNIMNSLLRECEPDEVAVLVEVPDALAKNSRYLGEMDVSLITPDIPPGESVKVPLRFKLPEGMTLLNPVTEEVTVTRKKK